MGEKGDDCADWKRSQKLGDLAMLLMRVGSFVNQPQLSLQWELEVDASVAAWLCKCRQGSLSHPCSLPLCQGTQVHCPHQIHGMSIMTGLTYVTLSNDSLLYTRPEMGNYL